MAGRNPEDGPDYMVMYTDDVLLDSQGPLRAPTSCYPVHPGCETEAESKKTSIRGGRLITPQGLKTNARLAFPIAEFLRLLNLSKV